MKPVLSIRLLPVSLCTLLLAGAVFAAPTAKPAAVQGVTLSKLCDSCVVVNHVGVQNRKGSASGVGAVGGAVAGGVVGRAVTDGGALGTVGGAVVGGLAGNQIEKHMKAHKVWVTTATRRDGTVAKFEQGSNPGWKAGTVLNVGANGQLARR